MHLIKKRHFQLLEVMIAIFLVIVCAMPILSSYVNMNRMQIHQLREQKRDHLAQLIYAKIVEQLYKRAPPFQSWQDVTNGQIEKIEKLPDLEQIFIQLQHLSYEVTFQFKRQLPKRITTKTTEYLFQLDLIFNDLLNNNSSHKDVKPVVYAYDLFMKHELDSKQINPDDKETDPSKLDNQTIIVQTDTPQPPPQPGKNSPGQAANGRPVTSVKANKKTKEP